MLWNSLPGENTVLLGKWPTYLWQKSALFHPKQCSSTVTPEDRLRKFRCPQCFPYCHLSGCPLAISLPWLDRHEAGISHAWNYIGEVQPAMGIWGLDKANLVLSGWWYWLPCFTRLQREKKHSAFSCRDVRIPMLEKATGTFNLVEQQDFKLISHLCKVAGNAPLTPADFSWLTACVTFILVTVNTVAIPCSDATFTKIQGIKLAWEVMHTRKKIIIPV